MTRSGRLRWTALRAVLIVSTVQGLTPDARTLASPRAVSWLGDQATTGAPDAGRSRMPGDDRPSHSDDDARSVEVVLPGETVARNLPGRQPTDGQHPSFASIGLHWPSDGPAPHPGGRESRAPGPVADLTVSLCRLTC